MKKIDKLNIDISLISSKIDDYYLKYGELPVLCDYLDKTQFESSIIEKANFKGATLNCELNPDDGDEYVVIDLEKLDGLTLNYGYDTDGEYNTLKTNKQITLSSVEDEIYVINTTSHQIYFPHGIFADGIMYYTFE